MDSVLRAAAVYVGLLVFIRLTGKRTLGQVTTFDFVLLLIIGEATQQALLGEDFSVTNALLVILTLLCIDMLLSQLKKRSRTADNVLDDTPVVLVARGTPLEDRMKHEGIDAEDVLVAARETQGLERMDQIRYAVLERSGKISVIPNS